MMLIRLLTIALFVASWTITGIAHGAMPSPDEVVALSRSHQASPGDVDLTYVENNPGAPSRRAMRIRARATGELRLDSQDLTTGETRTQLWLPSAPAPAPAVAPPPSWIGWFLGWDIDGILKTLRVDRAQVSLGHDGAEILWVLGATPQEPTLPQIHVERQGGALRRMVEISGQEEELRPQIYAFDAPVSPDASTPPAHRWPTGLTVHEGEGTTHFVLRRWVNAPTFSEETFRRPSVAPAGEEPR